MSQTERVGEEASAEVQRLLRERYKHILEINEKTRERLTGLAAGLKRGLDADDPSVLKKHHSHAKHKKQRRRSDSSSSSSRSRSPATKDQKSDTAPTLSSLSIEEIQKLKEEAKQKKALMKLLETPEEKRARRLAKKEAKERFRRERMGWGKEYLGYTNDDNPFGDRRLSETFVWKKKLDTKGLSHLDHETIQQLQSKKMEENKLELEAVRRRRLEREREKEEREKELELLQRDKEAEYYKSWEQQEDTFHLEQAKLRSRIRIADGRAKPIDLLSKYIADQDENNSGTSNGDISSAIELLEPTQFLVGLGIEDLEDLIEDIKVVYMELEKGQNVEYWRDITVVVEDELRKLRQIEAFSSNGRGGGGETSAANRNQMMNISQSVLQSVAATLKGKSYSQLEALERQIQPKLKGGEGVDVAYWETLSQFVAAQMARTRLRERHQENLRRKLAYLQQVQGITSEPIFPSGSYSGGGGGDSNSTADQMVERILELESTVREKAEQQMSDAKAVDEDDSNMFKRPTEPEPSVSSSSAVEGSAAPSAEPEVIVADPYDSALYSPKLLEQADIEIDAVIYDAHDDVAKLEYQRQDVRHTGALRRSAEEEMLKRARAGIEEGDSEFSLQVPLEDQSFLWSDKYRPRKPRFFNRVHTGFVWNKYNQTHYDLDNPPPKIVQGYKFNIFYPDLIDKTKAPTYTLTPCADEPDFAVLRFVAGPPYEDIAFKIVNREWEYSYKHGFRCQFHNTIFQLWFHFKRFRYRR
ncbi:hypothetical protein AAHC03_0566 [Spirometra sp. Aus1]